MSVRASICSVASGRVSASSHSVARNTPRRQQQQQHYVAAGASIVTSARPFASVTVTTAATGGAVRKLLQASALPTNNGASAASATLCAARRGMTTGENHSYTPGPIARGARRLFTALTPDGVRRRVAARMQRGLEQAERLEREQHWMRLHGSPLAVMGLPDHAELAEVRARYRHLVLETHPDTEARSRRRQTQQQQQQQQQLQPSSAAAAASATGATGGGENSAAAVVPLSADEDEYQILQTAYKMATDRDSLWHRSGSAPALYDQLAVAQRASRRRHALSLREKGGNSVGAALALAGDAVVERLPRVRGVTIFALLSYAVMGLIGLFFSVVVVSHALEAALQFFDPEFYHFMTEREKDERLRAERGEVVDTDPKRLAPTAVKRLLFPGRYIHGDADEGAAAADPSTNSANEGAGKGASDKSRA